MQARFPYPARVLVGTPRRGVGRRQDTDPSWRRPYLARAAFTLIEIMIAIGIFSLVLASIYSSWTAILRASKTGLEVAASVQRMRIAVRMLEDSLGSAQSYAANLPYYYFMAQSGNQGALSFVARLSKTFPRSGKFGDLDVRRVTFSVEPGQDGTRDLVLRQMPIVMDEPDPEEKANPLVLVKNVKSFELQFLDSNKNPPEWVDEWTEDKTNQLPKMVLINLTVANNPKNPQALDQIIHLVSIPSVTVQRMWQLPINAGRPGMPGSMPGQPGFQPPPGFNPNQPPNPNAVRPMR
ncbi:MAG TPA: type II secretion system protein GspJ [Candidatus Acidoferrum sp.]|nr:type II secretion system protein GspJ [Candidatus Acidoferrum sp.]